MKKHFVIGCLALSCLFSSVTLLCSFKPSNVCKASKLQIENAAAADSTSEHCWCTLDANCICTCGHVDHRLYRNIYE